jgi:flagellar hook-associated protein 2
VGLRFDPMGGGQFKSAMNAIIEAEKQPIKALEKRKEQENAKLKLFGDFKTKFNNLRSSLSSVIGFNKFKELKAELGDGSQFMTVSIDKEKANVGSWDVEIKELAERSSMISNGFSDPNKKILGVGYIQFDLPDGGSQEVYVTKNDASLYGIAAKINSVPDSPVKATVLKDVTDAEKPYRLVITSKKDGSDNEVKFPQMYFVDGQEELYVEQDKGAKNALLEVDGFEIELPSNENPDFLQGVGVQLKQAKPGQKFTMNVKADYPKVTEKLKKVIEGMNSVLEFINKQNQVNESSDTKSTFAGDTSLQNVEFRLRNLMHEGFATRNTGDENFKIYHLSDLGIEFDKAGALSLKEERFQKALETDFEGVAEAVSGEFGLAAQLKTVLDGYADASGVLIARERGIQTRIKQIDDNIANKQRNIEKKTESLTAQFSRLQSSLSDMQRQQNYLSSTLGGGGGGNPIAQLLGG